MLGWRRLTASDLPLLAALDDPGELDRPHAAARDLGEGVELHRLGRGQGQLRHRARNPSRVAGAAAPHPAPPARPTTPSSVAPSGEAPAPSGGPARSDAACRRARAGRVGRRPQCEKAGATRWHAGCVVSKLRQPSTQSRKLEGSGCRAPSPGAEAPPAPAQEIDMSEKKNPPHAAALRGGGRVRRRAAGAADPQRGAVPRRRRPVRRRPREVGRARGGRRQPPRPGHRHLRPARSVDGRSGRRGPLPRGLRRARPQGPEAQLGQLLAHPPGPDAHPPRARDRRTRPTSRPRSAASTSRRSRTSRPRPSR